jgi:ketosteroid isomerase-like protein
MSDEAVLRKLNEQYLRAYMMADVGWYDRHLADDFVCTRADGSVLDKPQFLRQTAQGPDVVEYRLERLRVRLEGDTAAVDGTGTFTLPDGSKGTSRYTDVYRRVAGEWKAVSAQISRVLNGKGAGVS